MRIAFLFVACLVVGCGGAVAGDDGGTGNDGGSGSDGSPTPDSGPQTKCPTSPPSPGASCSYANLYCEYGSNPSPDCNQLFLCQGGSWVDETTGSACPPQADCPGSYASVPTGQDCTPNGLACAYPEGTCLCTQSFGGLVKQTPAWDCFPEETGCPSPRPDIGTACSAPSSLSCDYGACSGGLELQCTDGTWQEVAVPCPG